MEDYKPEVDDICLVWLWDTKQDVKCKIKAKYKDYKKTSTAEECYDVEFLGDCGESTVTPNQFLVGAFKRYTDCSKDIKEEVE